MNTPRTDEAADVINRHSDYGLSGYVTVKFARQLETELAASQAKERQLREALIGCSQRLQALLMETVGLSPIECPSALDNAKAIKAALSLPPPPNPPEVQRLVDAGNQTVRELDLLPPSKLGQWNWERLSKLLTEALKPFTKEG